MSNTVVPETAPRRRWPRLRHWATLVIRASAVLYLGLLAVSVLAIARIGERFWLTTAALYVPRVVFAGPLPILCVALWLTGSRRLLWTQVLAAALVLFPLMGLVLPWPKTNARAKTFRILSFNVDSANAGVSRVVEAVLEEQPDIVVLVEVRHHEQLVRELRARYPYVLSNEQFLVASRFELSEAKEVAHQLDDHPLFSAQAMRYLVATPLGAVALYALHPTSPRGAFHIYRFHGALRRLASRDLWAKGPEAQIQSNASVRSAQVLAVARAAALERVPVVVVGDTNLPGLSPILRRAFSAYQDGFQAAGWGFGYTFPGKQPFLRLDRILAGAFFRFARFGMGCRGASDHLCVWADLGRP